MLPKNRNNRKKKRKKVGDNPSDSRLITKVTTIKKYTRGMAITPIFLEYDGNLT
jgi:hypothetical protein